jgi:hypothetical protein
MIPDAIEVRLKPKERAVLEARLRAASTQCPSSGALRQFEAFVKGGSGSVSVSA